MSAPTTTPVSWIRRHQAPVAVIGILALALLVHFPIFTSSRLDVDEASIGSIAQGLLRGGHLYTNLVDRKPPLLFYVYAGSFWATGSNSLIPVRLLIVALEAATGLLIGVASCREWKHRVAVAALFVLGTATFPFNDAHAAGFEAFMLLPITLAWYWSRRGHAALAALALVIAVLIKQPAAFTVVPVAYNLWRRPDGRRQLAVLTATGGLTYLAVAALFGIRQFLFWNISSNGSYLGVYSMIGTIGVGLLSTATYAASHVVMVWLAARGWPQRRLNLDLWLWLGSAFVGVAVGEHFFGHYFFQMLPPLAALAATQIARVTLRSAMAVAGATTALWLAFSVALPRPDLPPYEAVVREVDRLTTKDQAVFVWGSYSEVTWASQRPMATRFPHTNFVTGVDQGRPTKGALADLCHDLDHSRPEVIVDTSPADLRDAGKVPLFSVAQMAAVMRSYEPVDDLDNVIIYRLSHPWQGC
ncbi:MAG TPA: hypothetical protein VMT43_09410 [Acidimicrobiales bacterium]|nr:hypothetical protein [Acidimicrobiales bacterium]